MTNPSDSPNFARRQTRQAGFGLVEVMILAAVIGILLLLANQIFEIVLRQQNQNNISYVASQIKNNMAQLLNESASWQNTYNYSGPGQNTNLACLATGTPCVTPTPLPIDYILNAGGSPNNIVYKPGAGTGSGSFFNPQGGACAAGHTFHAPPTAGDDYCPLRFQVTWQYVCVGPACSNQLTITATFNGSPSSKIIFDPKNYSLGPFSQGSSTGGACGWAYDPTTGYLTETCANDVGIKTAAPASLLTLYSPTNASEIQLSNAAGHFGFLTAGTGNDATWISGGGFFNGTNWWPTQTSTTLASANATGFVVNTASGDALTAPVPVGAIPNFLVSSTSGYVGIFNASPSHALDITGPFNLQNVARVQSSSTDTGIELWNATPVGHDWRMISSGTGSGDPAGSFGIQDDSVGPVRFLIGTDGTVTLGNGLVLGGTATTGTLGAPTTINGTLTVGGVSATANVTVSLATTMSPTATIPLPYGAYTLSSAYNYISDVRLKTDIREIEDPLDQVLNLHGVNFKWKSNQQEDVGFIAQDVEKVVPVLVSTTKEQDGQSIKSVKYGNLYAVIVEGIKSFWNRLMDQDSRIEQLETANQQLQSESEILEKENAVLERHLPELEHRVQEPGISIKGIKFVKII